MTQALHALPHDDLPDEEDLLAGSDILRGQIRIDEPRWHAVDPVGIADVVLTALVAHAAAPTRPSTCDILFTDDDAISRLNGAFRGKPEPTNVLAFPSSDPAQDGATGPAEIGGIALGFGVMEKEARERGIPLAHHTTHLTLHGVLHLLGLDHEHEADRLAMERAEIDILQGLGISDPYEGS